jgi:MFS transporter, PHS family, inorganic phosphate transporter
MILQWRLYRNAGREVVPQSEEDAIAVLQGNDPAFVIGDIEEEDQNNPIHMLASNPGLWAALKTEPRLFTKLLGTAGTWFLFDVLFYGNTLFQPIVMEAAFGTSVDENSELKKAATDSLILAMIALPGYIVSALVIGKRLCYIQQTPRYVQLQGFFAMALLYAIIGAYWGYLKRLPSLLVFVYGMTFFFANYGPNTTTFVFPSLVFSPECRSTLNGIAAASGKAGALFGATLFAPAADAFGDSSVMLICAGVAVVAFGFTFCFAKMPDTTRLAGNTVVHRV